MADITASTGGGHDKHRKRRSNRQVPRVDMTPMVDLGFLLITFFMLSMQMHKDKCLELDKRIPVDNKEPVSECCVLNILIDSADRIFSYEGFDLKNMRQTSFSHVNGIEQVILGKSKRIKNECGVNTKGQRRDLICLIKFLPHTRYQNMVDMMDDADAVKHLDTAMQYSMQEPLADEVTALKDKEKELRVSFKSWGVNE